MKQIIQVVLVMVVLFACYAYPRYRQQNELTGCKSNLKNVATALEMYSCENTGEYPPSLPDLTPSYLKSLPECPAANTVTYAYELAHNPDWFTLSCKGGYHTPPRR